MNVKKVLILGSTGMLGHQVYYYLKQYSNYEIIDVAFRRKLHEGTIILDITKKEQVEAFINKCNPNIIINCIGVLISGSKSNPANAIYVNSFFPHQLAHLARKIGAKVIHISTDCVFSGNKGSYHENDLRDADDVYGRSKALGELINNDDLTIRTSIIGPELKQSGEGLFNWFMQQKGTINGYVNAFWGGVTTLELAKAITKAIESNIRGIVHLTNNEKISKFELLLLFQEVWNKNDVEIQKYAGKYVDKSLIQDSEWYKVPSYKEMLIDLRIWMNSIEIVYDENY